MRDDITVRAAIDADYDALVSIKEDACLLYGDSYKSDIPFTFDDFVSFQKDGHILVASNKSNNICGYSGSYKIENDFFLYHLFVARNHGGHGIGSLILKNLVNMALQQKKNSITLITSASAPWNGPFYKRQGFAQLEEKDMPEYLRKKWISSRDYFSPQNPITSSCPLIVPRIAMQKML